MTHRQRRIIGGQWRRFTARRSQAVFAQWRRSRKQISREFTIFSSPTLRKRKKSSIGCRPKARLRTASPSPFAVGGNSCRFGERHLVEPGDYLIAMSSAGLRCQRHTTKKKKVLKIVAASSAICISIDSFSEVNRYFFNIMACSPLPSVIHTIRLEGRQEKLDNLDAEVSKPNTEASDVLQKKCSCSLQTRRIS